MKDRKTFYTIHLSAVDPGSEEARKDVRRYSARVDNLDEPLDAALEKCQRDAVADRLLEQARPEER